MTPEKRSRPGEGSRPLGEGGPELRETLAPDGIISRPTERRPSRSGLSRTPRQPSAPVVSPPPLLEPGLEIPTPDAKAFCPCGWTYQPQPDGTMRCASCLVLSPKTPLRPDWSLGDLAALLDELRGVSP